MDKAKTQKAQQGEHKRHCLNQDKGGPKLFMVLHFRGLLVVLSFGAIFGNIYKAPQWLMLFKSKHALGGQQTNPAARDDYILVLGYRLRFVLHEKLTLV